MSQEQKTIQISWDSIEKASNRVLEEIKKFELDARGRWIDPVDGIVGLTRGGLIPAVILSHKLGLPMRSLDYSSKQGEGDKHHSNIIPDWFKNGRWIVIDDIVDSGYTFEELNRSNLNSVFCALYLRHVSRFKPKYYSTLLITDEWLGFPWEK